MWYKDKDMTIDVTQSFKNFSIATNKCHVQFIKNRWMDVWHKKNSTTVDVAMSLNQFLA